MVQLSKEKGWSFLSEFRHFANRQEVGKVKEDLPRQQEFKEADQPGTAQPLGWSDSPPVVMFLGPGH